LRQCEIDGQKSCRERDRMRRGTQLAKQKFFEKKTFAHKNEGQKSCRGRGRMRRGAMVLLLQVFILKPSLIRTKVKKSCRGRVRMRRGAQLAKQKFFKKKPSLTRTKVKKSCRGRGRTSTRQLASTQSLVVNPGRPDGRLYAVFIPYSSPSRQEGMSAKNFITPQY